MKIFGQAGGGGHFWILSYFYLFLIYILLFYINIYYFYLNLLKNRGLKRGGPKPGLEAGPGGGLK